MKTLQFTLNEEINLLVALDFYLDRYIPLLRETTQSLLVTPDDENLKSMRDYYCSIISELQSLRNKIDG